MFTKNERYDNCTGLLKKEAFKLVRQCLYPWVSVSRVVCRVGISSSENWGDDIGDGGIALGIY